MNHATGVLPTEHNPPIAVVNNRYIADNLGATFAIHLGMEAKIEALESRTSGALLFLASQQSSPDKILGSKLSNI
ncbi:hypothetical protein [Pseudomonas kulmbachensis]|uniref:hypothetical protein n=1 Tax=Pseudomonas kulmbachensis TaxID=3043408 RepID=UPI002AB0A424|nr:hypothetical protein [Pseudomonas sp. FLM 004-28]